jgi:hypothetical protein
MHVKLDSGAASDSNVNADAAAPYVFLTLKIIVKTL